MVILTITTMVEMIASKRYYPSSKSDNLLYRVSKMAAINLLLCDTRTMEAAGAGLVAVIACLMLLHD